MSTEFAGKVAVVTGAGSGIGRSTALLLARLGAKVHVTDVDGGAAETVRAAIEAAGGSAVAHAVDVADPAAVEELAERVFAQDGAADVLHNNAGVGHAGPVEDTELADWQRIIDINVMGTIHGVHSFVPRMLRQGRPAHIANTASMAGLVANAQMAPYCTSKFAVVGLSQALNAELSPKGIHVSAICPGVIDTAIVRTTTYRGDMASRSGRIGDFYAKRGTSPDVVAEAVVNAIRKNRVIQPTPRWHVMPAWIVQRISPRAAQLLARNTIRFIGG